MSAAHIDQLRRLIDISSCDTARSQANEIQILSNDWEPYLEGLRRSEILELQEHVGELENLLNRRLRFNQCIDHLFSDRSV